jgi:hypothetical protein
MHNFHSNEIRKKRSIAEMYTNAGQFFSVIGSGLLITEAIIGLFGFEISMLVMMYHRENNSRRNNNNSFLLGYLYANMSKNNWRLTEDNLVGMVLLSFAQSILAALLLTVEFNMPLIALAVAGAWVATALMIYAGKQLEEHGNKLTEIIDEEERIAAQNASRPNQYLYYGYPSQPAYPQTYTPSAPPPYVPNPPLW